MAYAAVVFNVVMALYGAWLMATLGRGLASRLVMAMTVVSPQYLEPYGDLLGQAVLCLVAGCFAAAWQWLARLQCADRPVRILAGSTPS